MSIQPRRLDKYELQQCLGRGGMAEVWKAHDTQLHRYVAIKLLHADLQNDPNFVERFEREARLIASLHHPNIVRIYDFRVAQPPEVAETTAYMVMEYVEGQTLARYLQTTSRAGKFLSSARLVQLFTPICLAIDYAHQQGMLHRDIKPSNILLDRRDQTGLLEQEVPILSDFGVARLLNASVNTHSGWWMGTPLYMSPEQVMGEAGDERSDIYALSIILYEACTGAPPFRGETPTAIAMQHINARPVPPRQVNPAISPNLAAVILRGMARRPEERYASASALGIALAEALHEPVAEALQRTAALMADMTERTTISPIRSIDDAQPSPIPGIAPPDVVAASPLSTPIIATPATSQPMSAAKSEEYKPPPVSEPLSAKQGANGQGRVQAQEGNGRGPAVREVSRAIPTIHGSGSPRQHMLRIVMSILLIVAGVGALLFLLLPRLTPAPHIAAPPRDQVVGHAFFLSSGQLDPTNSKGINDEVQLDLSGIPQPPSGKADYAWLLGDKLQSEAVTTPLGRLTIEHGAVHLLYTGNAQHTNLLATMSRILVTQETDGAPPVTYTPDTHAWLYYAQLSQAASPRDKLHFSMLDHLRHLLSESPELKLRNLHGGLDMWFLRNTQKVLEWSTAARDDWRRSPDLQHRQFIRILDYIEGAAFVQKDEPLAWPVVFVDPHEAQIGLVGPVPDGSDPPGYNFDDEPSPGYVYLISSHLAGTVLSPDATADQRILADRIHAALDQTRVWLENAHQDAKRLVHMNNQQLMQPEALTLLNDLVRMAQQAYVGQVEPISGAEQGGAIWICNNIQRMANFELKPFKGL